MSSIGNGVDHKSVSGRSGHGGSYRATWGSLQVTDSVSARRSGLTRYRLEIFPPGTNDAERRQLRRFRQWRMWGAVAAISGIFLIAGAWPGWQAPAYIAASYLAGLMFGLHATTRLRRATHTLTVARTAFAGAVYIEGDLDLLETCVAELDRLDCERSDDTVSALQYELAWAGLYERLGVGSVASEA